MDLSKIINYESSVLILKALLENKKEVSLRCSEMYFLTSNITKQINILRSIEIDIKTEVNTDVDFHYAKYTLVQDEDNIKRTVLLLEKIEVQLS